MMSYCQLNPGTNLVKFELRYNNFHARKCIRKCCLHNVIHFVQASMCQKLYRVPLPTEGEKMINLCSKLYSPEGSRTITLASALRISRLVITRANRGTFPLGNCFWHTWNVEAIITDKFMLLQCGAVITQSILSQIRYGEVWGVFCGSSIWLIFCPVPVILNVIIHVSYTVETLYNTVNFCWSTHKRHSIARPKGRGMGCLLWVQRATYSVDLSKLSSIKYLL